ncbi:MAG: glycosyltransferase family 25 protein [Nitrososphaerota archaeon]
MVDRTYVINLRRCGDRRRHMENELIKLAEKKVNLNHVFFDAVDGKSDEDLEKFKFNIPNWCDPNTGKAMTRGEIGCALSHYSIWLDVVNLVENESLPKKCRILILEDDVIFLEDFDKKFVSYISEIGDYDLLYLHRKPLRAHLEKRVAEHITTADYSYWACAYILTYSGAKKLVNANYLEFLIPVDEFIPIMSGCKVNGFEKFYEKAEKLNCYAVTPSLLRLVDDSFGTSQTFHSEPYCSHNVELSLRNDNNFQNKEFLLLYLGKMEGDSFDRFSLYCRIYGLSHHCLEGTLDNMKKLMDTWDGDKLDSSFFVVMVMHPDNHYCGIIPNAPPIEIMRKFFELANQNDVVVHNHCSYLFACCGMGRCIKNFFEIHGEKIFSKSFMTIEGVVVDQSSEIFMNLDKENVFGIDYKKSRVTNKIFGSFPCFVYADRRKRVILNQIGNYTGNGWNEYYGYSQSSQLSSNQKLPKIYISFYVKTNSKILEILENLNYPKELVVVRKNYVGCSNTTDGCSYYSHEEELYQKDILEFLKTDCSYYFFVNHNCILTNPNILIELLSLNKKIVSPLIRRLGETWSNFWGDIREDGYYKRSFDYLDILNGHRIGCWNVPYITGVYLVKREVLESQSNSKITDIFVKNSHLDIDMRFCHNLREKDIFMYVTNISCYGYMERESEELFVPSNLGELTLYHLLDRRAEWERKYLHPLYLQYKDHQKDLVYEELCPDIYNFPLFTEEFCKELIGIMEKSNRWSQGGNSHYDPRLGLYENYPTVDQHLFQVGLGKQWEEIVMEYIAPVAKLLYCNYKTKGVHLAFVVRYKVGEQEKLDPHHDASTYSINVALNHYGTDFEGGGTYFVRQKYTVRGQKVGTALIHPGRLTAYHSGLPITSGVRYILVSFIN